ncbi:uncharacterized protein NDAI_0C02410 [Naumovozyma dairenensis CBS 421]|uniref:Uncharacterized protein n=1 Tax=Naumovozyma dairenensis (strain ATCC 10597 / BCRC 20456 / CBS 421 / NBRC 0211 / NRRL Y-12639) TaxID=1071378 RepID=G0W7Z0_NAUDC|nr:hypothetical protein NDAI_0C02410 [Naumovozyma dairenensis CBS 421]CCD23901.1 hypothetical protein NDAI_0C02410 [Naumovozyma dairenensis CBS 421]
MSRLVVEISQLNENLDVINKETNPVNISRVTKIRCIVQLLEIEPCQDEIGNNNICKLIVTNLPDFQTTSERTRAHIYVNERLFASTFIKKASNRSNASKRIPQSGDALDLLVGIWNNGRGTNIFEAITIELLRLEEVTALRNFLPDPIGADFLKLSNP